MARANGCTGSRWKAGAAPATVSEQFIAKPETGSGRTTPAACGDARRRRRTYMKAIAIAGLAGLACAGAHAQSETVVVTASRAINPSPTLRDAIVITRDDIEAAGPVSLGELLQRRAGVELRAVGGPGQPQTIFIRGAGTAQTLVLVDGMRVGSATVGTTSIEHIPLEMIERIEVVKGPLSSLYGPEAIGGVIQVFTRGKAVPHLFASVEYGTDNDRR